MGKATVVAKGKEQRQRGLAGDRWVVELRGAQYFIVDGRSGMTFGGPFADRAVAQEKADGVNRSLGWRR